MSTSEVFMIPDNRTCQNNFDPNLLLASMMNGNNGFGGNGNWIWVIFLFFLYPLMRNGGFWGNNCNDGNGNLSSLGNLVNNDAGRELLSSAGEALTTLTTGYHIIVFDKPNNKLNLIV